MKIIYDRKQHIENLLRILEKDLTCYLCPIEEGQPMQEPRIRDRFCNFCRSFIGLRRVPYHKKFRCPCETLGSEEAVKRSWLAIEESGYLK